MLTEARHAPLAKLEPAKVRSALRRRWFEHHLNAFPLEAPPPGALEDLGSIYGGWTIPTAPLTPEWCCYCVGIGGDVSFERTLIDRFGVTTRSFEAAEGYVTDAATALVDQPRATVHHAAIAGADGPLRVQLTHHPGSRSVSAAGLYDSAEYVEVPGRSLPSLMAEFGDPRIDLLKLDIEGAEYALLADLDLQALGVRIFATQLHHTGTVRDARRLIEHMKSQGYHLVARRPTIKLCFVARTAAVRR